MISSYLSTNIHGVWVFFMVSRLNSSGSWSFNRRYIRLRGGMTPKPRHTRHATLKWLSVQANTTIMGASEEATNPMSIWTLVNMMNHLFLWPSFNSPVLSAQATLPAGYSPLGFCQPQAQCLSRGTRPIPIPSRNRQAVSAESMPLIVPPPYDPALRAANMKSMMVEVIRAHFRET